MTTKSVLRGIVRMFSKERPGTILKRWRTRKDGKVTTSWGKGEAEHRVKAAERRKQERRRSIECILCDENIEHNHKRKRQKRQQTRRVKI